MFKLSKPFFIVCETPLHCGSGNDIGIVDLPIQRERHTDFPKIEGSSLKGGIREAFEELPDKTKLLKIFRTLNGKWVVKKDGKKEVKKDKDGKELTLFDEAVQLVFGPDVGSDHAGALGFSDARLLLFPVKSMKGLFVWVTCPKVLKRFKNDLSIAAKSCSKSLNDFGIDFEIPETYTAPKECSLFIKNDKIVLEEYTFEITRDADANNNCTKLANWLSKNLFPANNNDYSYWREKIKKDIVVLSDDDFRDFVTLSTEVITRTKIDNKTGTVQTGALFTEEYLPSEAILYSLAFTSPICKEKDSEKGIFKQNGKKEEELVMEFFQNGLSEIIQLGGNATIGKGIVRTKVLEVNNA